MVRPVHSIEGLRSAPKRLQSIGARHPTSRKHIFDHSPPRGHQQIIPRRAYRTWCCVACSWCGAVLFGRAEIDAPIGICEVYSRLMNTVIYCAIRDVPTNPWTCSCRNNGRMMAGNWYNPSETKAGWREPGISLRPGMVGIRGKGYCL